jgi:ribonuclease-3
MGPKKAKTFPDLEALQERIGRRFGDPALLDLALTHRSHGHESGRGRRNNEALEFLGDAVLGFLVAERLWEASGGRVEVGALARQRASLVSEVSLAPRACALGLGEVLRLGKGEEATGGREKDSLLADAFEAVVAAIYLDGGLEAARAFILEQFEQGLRPGRKKPLDDPKTRLQEALQARGRPLPEYRVTAASGPDHKRSFTVDVVIGGRSVARGEGRSKKVASIEAARKALEKLPAILKRRAAASRRRPGGAKD